MGKIRVRDQSAAIAEPGPIRCQVHPGIAPVGCDNQALPKRVAVQIRLHIARTLGVLQRDGKVIMKAAAKFKFRIQ